MNKHLLELLSRFKGEKNKAVRVSAGSLVINNSNVDEISVDLRVQLNIQFSWIWGLKNKSISCQQEHGYLISNRGLSV